MDGPSIRDCDSSNSSCHPPRVSQTSQNHGTSSLINGLQIIRRQLMRETGNSTETYNVRLASHPITISLSAADRAEKDRAKMAVVVVGLTFQI
jgi:hypothetical protein